MYANLSKASAATIRSSLPLMESKRDAIEAAMSRGRGQTGAGDRSAHNPVAAAFILDMLFDHAGRISGAGGIAAIESHGLRHRRLAIGAGHYSAFGDRLAPIMKDVLGAEATPAVVAAWGDTYWAIVRMVAAEPLSMAA